MIREKTKQFLQPQRLKKFIDWMAYGSLGLDICITVITLSSIFFPSDIEKYIGTVNVALSIVVIMSIASAVMIVGVRVYEELLFRTCAVRYNIKNRVRRLRSFDWIRHKLLNAAFDPYEWRRRVRRVRNARKMSAIKRN